jgi:hypothetical protein
MNVMAHLMGYPLQGPLPWPDGSVPDVFRVGLDGKRVFIGDAKHVESPIAFETYTRLSRYVTWWRMADHRRDAVFCVGFSRTEDARKWKVLLRHFSAHRKNDADLDEWEVTLDGAILLFVRSPGDQRCDRARRRVRVREVV